MKLKDWLDNNYTVQEQKNFTSLDCSGEGITSLKGIEGLTKLEELNCHSNKLISLKGIENLNKLGRLVCYGNKLRSLKGIENLDKLKTLYSHNNPLPYSNYDLKNLKLDVKKEVRQDKIHKLLKSVL